MKATLKRIVVLLGCFSVVVASKYRRFYFIDCLISIYVMVGNAGSKSILSWSVVVRYVPHSKVDT